MDNIIGYTVFDSSKLLWLTEDGDWSRRFTDAADFNTLNEANKEMQSAERHEPASTFYVLAVMESPS